MKIASASDHAGFAYKQTIKEHNDANMISLGQRMISIETAVQIVDIWLTTPFDGGRHQRRIEKVEQI